jgi:hypothetical protein
MAKPAQPAAGPSPGDRPVVERNDEIYFRDKAGKAVYIGKVLAHGEHGCTVDRSGKRHQIRWENVLGHKTRVQPALSIVDEGEDGFVAKNKSSGQLRYVHDPLTTGEEDLDESPLAKNLALMARPTIMPSAIERIADMRRAQVSMLAKAIANRPGLSLQPVTDAKGHQTKRWKKTGQDQRAGHHDAKEGDRVKFAGGEGTILSHGPKGAHVQDAQGKVHKVAWGDVHERSPGRDIHQRLDRLAERRGDPKPHKPFFGDGETDHLPGTHEVAQPHASWSDLQKHGQEAVEHFEKVLGGIAKAMGLRVDVELPEGMTDEHAASGDGFLFVAPLKSEKRAKEKVEADYEGDWSKLKDLVRASISVPSVADIHEALRRVKESGLEMAAQPKDRFAKPTQEGYRDLNTLWTLPNGMIAELQFHISPMLAAKNEGHKHYETQRSIQAKHAGSSEPDESWSDEEHEQFYSSRKAQKDLYTGVWTKLSAS